MLYIYCIYIFIYIYRCAYAIPHSIPKISCGCLGIICGSDLCTDRLMRHQPGRSTVAARRFMKKLGGSPWLTDLAAAHLDPKNAGFDSYLFCICSAMFWYHWWLRCLDAWKLGGALCMAGNLDMINNIGAYTQWSPTVGHAQGDDGYRQIEGLQPLG